MVTKERGNLNAVQFCPVLQGDSRKKWDFGSDLKNLHTWPPIQVLFYWKFN